jgi:hypothetical protein
LTHLFLAHDEAIAIYRDNYDVILMDCTYRTNRFNMPLLNIVGVTGMNTTIHIAQVFLIGEEEPDYRWALQQLWNLQLRKGIPHPQVFFTDRDLALLNAIEHIFPSTPALLCLWHIMKDVQAHAEGYLFLRKSIQSPRSVRTQPLTRRSVKHSCVSFMQIVKRTTVFVDKSCICYPLLKPRTATMCG